MALSQLQCLDDNNVNPRTHESKPEFLYCEDQRLALETLLQDGREGYLKCLEARGLRGFLSDLEMETLAGVVEPYDPSSDIFPEDAEEGEPPLSLHYWPEVSDTSIPQMDLGWPDTDSYRGVTRTTVYSQPPLDGQAHIKEVVRKMIAQAQKVIALVMDIFTDVDIFRDLLDAGFKRRISVYILLERTMLPHFLSMCQRANMHTGHLKHLRVRCTGGADFHSRSSTKVTGRMGHRFMFIDGDKAVSGSYSFTWMSSRLDGNHITVVTGQAVDAFDTLFRTLYGTSNLVDLRQVATEPEPQPEPLPQIVLMPPPSAALAKKLYNPKYALALGNPSPSFSPSPTPLSGYTSHKNTESPENSRNPDVQDTKKRRRRRASKEAMQEAPPIHPGLTNLEKASLISYLPTWPEPDPPSDVIGFINIRDANKPNQVHLQRSEMFGVSQAIKFSSPFSMPQEILPEVAKPRQFTGKYEEVNKLQPAQARNKARELVEDRSQQTQLQTRPSEAKAPEQNSPASGLKSDKDTAKIFNAEDKLHSHSPTKTTSHINAHAPEQPGGKPSTTKTGRPQNNTQAVTMNGPQPNSFPVLITKREAGTSLNTQSAVAYKTHNLQLNSTQNSHLCGPTDSNTGQHTQTKTVLPHTESHMKAVHMQPQNSPNITPNIQTPTVNRVSPSSTFAVRSQSVSSTSPSENNHISSPTSTATSAFALSHSRSASLSPSSPSPLISPSATLNSIFPSSSTSSSLTSTPPIPKPRTIQLVIEDRVTRYTQKVPDRSVIRSSETKTGSLEAGSESAVDTMALTAPQKEPGAVKELQNKSESKTEAEKEAGNTANIREASQPKETGTFQETKNEGAVGRHDYRARVQLIAGTNLEAHSNVLMTDAPDAQNVHMQSIIPKDVQPKTLISTDCISTPKKDCVATVQAGTRVPESTLIDCELTEVQEKNSKNATQSKTCKNAHELQRKTYNALTPQDMGVIDTVDSFKAQTHDPGAARLNPHTSKDKAGDSTHTSAADANVQQDNPSSTHSTSQEMTPTARGSTSTNKRSLSLPLSVTYVQELRSPTSEREPQPHKALARTLTPDGILPHTPTSDLRNHMLDSRSYTPDLRTPTSDVSDGYVSSRPESGLSTTSEEYYECNESPSQEPACNSRGTTEFTLTHTNTSVSTTVTTSPADLNPNNVAATSGTKDKNTSGSETQSLSGPSSISSSSSLLEKQVKMGEKEKTANTASGVQEDKKGRKLSMAETRREGDPQETRKRGREEVKKTAEEFKQGKDLTEKTEKNKEAEPQLPKRKRAPNQSSAERLVNGRVALGELPNEGAQPKRWSTGDLKLKKVSSEGERLDKEKAADGSAVGPSGVERRGRSQSTREAVGQKILQSTPKLPRAQLQDNAASSSSSRPFRPPRSVSANQPMGPRPWGSRQPYQAETKALHSTSKVMDNTSSPRKPPSRPPPPMAAVAAGSTAGQRQTEVSQSQQSPLSQQPPAAQGRARAGQSPSQHRKSQASSLHTHSNTPPHPRSHSQTASAKEVQSQEEGKSPFSFTISKLYSLKGLKEKMTKLPAQSKKGSTNSSLQGHKSKS